jgi:putative transposase
LLAGEGLRRPLHTRKRVRIRPDTAERLAALLPHHVWAIDFQFDETTDGRRFKLLNIVMSTSARP